MSKFISGTWGHIFEADEHERMTRIVIDAESQKLVFAQIQRMRSMDSSYSEACRHEMADLEESLLDANADLFNDPVGFGLITSHEIPEWAANLT
ncbi:hypothetical protein HBO10_29515 [Pseudomonas sp. WS 5503]|uniref:hypothetical protein n=1 Tax=Pseudomonas TaxID=286 RepID=UPI001472C6B0|nr:MULTISPECIES: hypothetical protein [Pseudomonas]NMX83646.1 hypothetical protein [Pseudomonas sp. WS 5503]NNB23646.1 hypothetical protein [Pseudomonas fragi]